MIDNKSDGETEIPTDSDELSSEKQRSDEAAKAKKSAGRDDPDSPEEPNPPHTTTGFFTAPKFGAAGSGGLEIEPGPEKD